MPTEQDVNEVLRDVLALVHDALATHRIDARADLGKVPPVLADRVQLQQVILNLVMNGVDAVNERQDGPRNLVISTRALDEGQVTMTVQDSGVGVDPAVFDKLFDPFFTTKPGGSGLGLAVVHRAIDAHRGLVFLDSSTTGTRFTIVLPCVPRALRGEQPKLSSHTPVYT